MIHLDMPLPIAGEVDGLGGLTHRMWGFPEIPENLKWIVMVALAIGLAIFLMRNFSR
jgi:hypothetical protein